MKIKLLDNYDSFTWNLVEYLNRCGAEVLVIRNDQCSVEDFLAGEYDGIMISPGPGTPAESGILMDLLKEALGKKPILGICLGMQALGIYFGMDLKRAKKPMHGKISEIELNADHFIFKNLPSKIKVCRYHSLVIESSQANSDLEILAKSMDGEIMAIADDKNKICGLQFHPEAILTEFGLQMIDNWLHSLKYQ